MSDSVIISGYRDETRDGHVFVPMFDDDGQVEMHDFYSPILFGNEGFAAPSSDYQAESPLSAVTFVVPWDTLFIDGRLGRDNKINFAAWEIPLRQSDDMVPPIMTESYLQDHMYPMPMSKQVSYSDDEKYTKKDLEYGISLASPELVSKNLKPELDSDANINIDKDFDFNI